MSKAPHSSSASGPYNIFDGMHDQPAPTPAGSSTSSRNVASAPTRSIGRFHPVPVIGHPEAFYVKHAKEAEAAGDKHARASHKVGQYVTSGLTQGMPWEEKLRRFTHALDKYCHPPHQADDSLKAFYQKLKDIVRRHAGQEAIRVARLRNDEWMARLKRGESRVTLEDEAEMFFFELLGHSQCPDWCSKEAYNQIITWRDYWV
jgi:hypothetical protein